MQYKEIYQKLEEYEQLHLLKFYDVLNDTQKEQLLHQIGMVDFNLLKLCKNAEEPAQKGKLEPLGALGISEIEEKKEQFYKTGIEAIKSGKVGAVLLAGGQGTRLGFDKPKGMLNVGITKELFLFEALIKNVLEVVKQAEAWVPLYIMTSVKNNDETKEFFEEHNFFGYDKDYITFFIQDMAPSVDFNGKIYMEDKAKLSLSPNGNGGWFSSLAKAGILKKIKENGVEWLNVFSVDNVLQKIADPYFVGATIETNSVSGAKVVSKAAPDERVGVLCLEDGKPAIVEYYEMTDEIINSKDADGKLSYNYGVILNYLFRIKELEEIMNSNLPLHVVQKKIPYMNENGEFIKPEAPNGYKFESLVLDMIHMLDNCLSYEVERSKEFAPIKNKDGVDSLVSARELMKQNGIEL